MMDRRILPSELPDDTVVYAEGFGETTAGEIPGPVWVSDDPEGDAAIRMWLWTILYQPKAKPWKTAFITYRGKSYPLSVFDDNRFIQLHYPAGLYKDIDVDDPAAIAEAREKWERENPHLSRC